MSSQVQMTAGSDAERALEEALAVTPSPEFVARVREHVREEPARSTGRWLPTVAFAGAVVTAVILSTPYWSGGRRPDRAAAAGRPVARTAAVESAKRPALEPARDPSALPEGPRSRSSVARLAPPALAVGRALAREQAREVLISADERRTLDRFLIAVREGRASVPAPRRVLEDENGQLLEPRAVEIALMRPIEPLPGTAADLPRSRDQW